MAGLEEPDTGYAWVIAFAACIINMILSGISRMIGLLYVAIIDEYGVSRKEASVPFTVRNAIRYLSGPLVGVLGQRYGIRTVTFWGGVIACLGSVLCCFAPTVEWISVFWGAIHGLGLSLGMTLFQVIVNQYFEKYRATASGIVLSSACIGSFGFPFMIENILDNYGLFGCFLILGGIFLNVLPPSLILKSPPWIENPEEYARQRALIKGKGTEEPSETIQMQEDVEACKRHRKYSRSLSNCSIQESDVHGHTASSHKKFYQDIRVPYADRQKLYSDKDYREARSAACTSYSTSKSSFPDNSDKLSGREENADNDSKSKSKSTVNQIYGYEHLQSEEKSKSQTKENMPSEKPENNSSILEIIKNIAVLYKNPFYILISLNVTTYIWLFIPILTVVVDYSRDRGFPMQNEKFLIHALTMGDLIGRLCFGWVTDKKFLSFPVFMMLIFACQGLFVCLLPSVETFPLYMVVLILYGIAAGIVFVYFPVLVHKYVDEKNQPIGIGCVGLVSGMLTFGIPPVIGYFRDQIGSYNGLFYILGLLSISTGCLWLLAFFFLKCAEHKSVNNAEDI